MSRQSPYSKYGSFILFKKLDESALAEIWRAAPIDGSTVGPHIALLRFTGGDGASLRRAAEQAAKSLKTLEGSTVVRNQTYHLVGRLPVITWDYAGGRSLFHMLEVAAGGPQSPPNPFPLDQALAIAEKLALSLETTGQLKHGGQRLHHGVLIPQMIWVSEDGEVRTLGHQMTKGMLASLSRAPVHEQFGGFVAPELKRNGESTDPSEVWGIGANLFAMLTGKFPEAPTDQSAMDAALDDAILATDDPIPAEVRAVLAKSLAIDPARRYESPAALREAIHSLIQGGEYAPTTFNLAFYIHNLLRDEIDPEAAEREAEKGVDPTLVPPINGHAADSETVSQPPASAPVAAAAAPAAASTQPVQTQPAGKSSSRLPLIAAILVVLLLAGGAAGYWFTMGPGARRETPAQTASLDPASASADGAVRQPPPVESFMATTDTGDPGAAIESTTATGTALSDAELRQKMIQEEIDRRLQAEILKLQSEYDRKLREERGRDEPRATTPAPAAQKPAPAATTPSPAEQLDRQKLEQRPVQQPAPATQQSAASTSTAAASLPPAPASQEPPPAAVPQAPRVKEGDLVEYAEVDQAPKITRRVEPSYPPLAARQKAEATIIISALISETGNVIDIKILKGDPRRLGFEDAASDAIRKSTFQPALKEGKRVKTWMPVPVFFKAQ